jgi:hypothetical protein
MVGDRARRQVTEAVKDAAQKAGSLVTAAFALAAAALLLAFGVLIFAIRTRPRLTA